MAVAGRERSLGEMNEARGVVVPPVATSHLRVSLPPNHSPDPISPSNPPIQPLAADYQDPHLATAGWRWCWYEGRLMCVGNPNQQNVVPGASPGPSWCVCPSVACTSANLGLRRAHTCGTRFSQGTRLSDWKMHKGHQVCSLLPGYARNERHNL